MSARIKTVPLDLHAYHAYLKPRARDAHKGCFGHVLIIGGSPGHAGAVRLAGEAALRTGAGLVSIATHPAHAACLSATRPELMCYGIVEPTDLLPLIENASVLVIGPGLGQSTWSMALLHQALLITDKPLILDADALNLLPLTPYQAQKHHIFTPHPGEAARLLQITPAQLQTHRRQALHQLTQHYPGIVVLKGAQTLIGQQGHATIYECFDGNPGMASAGMGDLLTGIIAGLIAQSIPPFEAACLGVLLHALSADQAAKTGERGLIASDLFLPLRHLLNPG